MNDAMPEPTHTSDLVTVAELVFTGGF